MIFFIRKLAKSNEKKCELTLVVTEIERNFT